MNIYVYVITHDTGFAPNPLWNFCTLACCKPAIRRCAQRGDWIVGLEPKARCNGIVYAMKVTEKVALADYWADPRFKAKRPGEDGKGRIRVCGDNIYEPQGGGTFLQHHSVHSDRYKECNLSKETDLGGLNVLISENFSYFGSEARPRPEWFPVVGRGQLKKRVCEANPEDMGARMSGFVEGLPRGVHGRPRHAYELCGQCNSTDCYGYFGGPP